MFTLTFSSYIDSAQFISLSALLLLAAILKNNLALYGRP